MHKNLKSAWERLRVMSALAHLEYKYPSRKGSENFRGKRLKKISFIIFFKAVLGSEISQKDLEFPYTSVPHLASSTFDILHQRSTFVTMNP